jgi:hypothetical protein
MTAYTRQRFQRSQILWGELEQLAERAEEKIFAHPVYWDRSRQTFERFPLTRATPR